MNRHLFPSAGFLLFTISSLWAQQDKLLIPDMTGGPGDVFQWPVKLSGPSPVVGLQFDISYAAGQLTIVAGLPADGTVGVLVATREIEPGKTRAVVSSAKNAALPKDVVLDASVLLPATAPSGGPGYTISNLIFALADGTKVAAPAVEFGPVTNWRRLHFTPEELLLGAIIGDDADPDGDGAANLLEYAVAGNPRLRLTGEVPEAGQTIIIEGGEPALYLTLNYRKAVNAPGVLLQPQVSTDLLLWSAGANPIATGAGDGDSIPMQARVPMDAAASQFLRLNVTRKTD